MRPSTTFQVRCRSWRHPSPCGSACSSSFNLVRLYLGYQINPDALASFSVENLFNQQYSRYLDVAPSPGHGVNSTLLPFFSPGITIKGALTVRLSDLTLL